MKTIHIITGLDMGGAEIMLFRLLKQIDRVRFENQVISLIPTGAVGEKIRALGIPVSSLGMHPEFPSPFAVFRLMSLLRREQPAFLHTWMYHANLLGGLAGFAVKVPVIWAIHNSTTDPQHSRKRTLFIVRMCALLSRFIPTKIISCSEKARQIHVELGYDAEKFIIIPNGFDLGDYKPDQEAARSLRMQLGIEPATLLIGMVARYDPQKDHVNFIRAARIHHQTAPQTHFVLCGEGLTWENIPLCAEIDAAGLRSHFHLLGRRDDMPAVFTTLSLHALSSAYGEAFPNVLGEAMACGVPCVATDIGDSSFLIGDTGMVVPPKDPQALADAWERLLRLSAEERFALGERARQRIQQLFSIVQIARRYEDLYGQIV
jgi:glycosyltransferase involved in cell wall biosynthesis